MKRKIQDTSFGSITIDDTRYEHDVIIRCNGVIQKRKKKLSKAIFGTSHIISEDEARYLYEKGCEKLIIGTGQNDTMKLSKEAKEFFASKNVKVVLRRTPKAIEKYNRAEGPIAAMFHVTC